MMRLLACLVLVTPLVAKRLAITKKHLTKGITEEDLEATWLSIVVTRSGSFFSQGDEVVEVDDGEVFTEDAEEPFGSLVVKQGVVHLETVDSIGDIWAVTGSETNEESCSKWNEYLALVEKMKNEAPPMYVLAQTNSTETDTQQDLVDPKSENSPIESDAVACVDWVHAGETKPPPSGMYSMLETQVTGERTQVTGERTMHWLRKSDPVEDAVGQLAKELAHIAPPRTTLQGKMSWLVEAIEKLSDKPSDQVVPTVLGMVDNAEYDLGMAEQKKLYYAESILAILVKIMNRKAAAQSNAQDD